MDLDMLFNKPLSSKNMQAEVVWGGSSKMTGINQSGQKIEMDWEDGPSPMQILLQMVGSCSLVDVVHSLEKRRSLKSASISMEAERAQEPPRKFTSIHMIYHVHGDEIPEKMVNRVIETSLEKYCSVSNTLSDDVKITWELQLNTNL